MTSALDGEYEVLRRNLVKTGYPDSAPREKILNGDTLPLLPLIYYALCQFSPLVNQHILDTLGYNLKGLSDRKFVKKVYSLLREEYNFVPRLKFEEFLTTSNYAWLKLCLVNQIFAFMLDTHHMLKKQHRLKRKQKATRWSETTLSKRVTATIASHQKSKANRLAKQKNARTKRRRRSEARQRRTRRAVRQERSASSSRSPKKYQSSSSRRVSKTSNPSRTRILTDDMIPVSNLRKQSAVMDEKEGEDDTDGSSDSSSSEGEEEDGSSSSTETDSDESVESGNEEESVSDDESEHQKKKKSSGMPVGSSVVRIQDIPIDLHESSNEEENDHAKKGNVMSQSGVNNDGDEKQAEMINQNGGMLTESSVSMSNRQPYNPQGYENDETNATEEVMNPALNPYFYAPPPSSSDGNSSADYAVPTEMTPAKSASAKLPTIEEETADDSGRIAVSNSTIERTHIAIVAELVKKLTAIERAFHQQSDNVNARLILIEGRMSAMESLLNTTIQSDRRLMYDSSPSNQPRHSAPALLPMATDKEDEKREDIPETTMKTSSAPASSFAHQSSLLGQLNSQSVVPQSSATAPQSSLMSSSAAVLNQWPFVPATEESSSPAVPSNENATIGSPLPLCSLTSKSRTSGSAAIGAASAAAGRPVPSSSSSGLPSGLPDVPKAHSVSDRISQALLQSSAVHNHHHHHSGESLGFSTSPSLLKYPVTSSSDGMSSGAGLAQAMAARKVNGLGTGIHPPPSSSSSPGFDYLPRITTMSDITSIGSTGIHRVHQQQFQQQQESSESKKSSGHSDDRKSDAPFTNPFAIPAGRNRAGINAGASFMNHSDNKTLSSSLSAGPPPSAAIYRSIALFPDGDTNPAVSGAAAAMSAPQMSSSPDSDNFSLNTYIQSLDLKISHASALLKATEIT